MSITSQASLRQLISRAKELHASIWSTNSDHKRHIVLSHYTQDATFDDPLVSVKGTSDILAQYLFIAMIPNVEVGEVFGITSSSTLTRVYSHNEIAAAAAPSVVSSNHHPQVNGVASSSLPPKMTTAEYIKSGISTPLPPLPNGTASSTAPISTTIIPTHSSSSQTPEFLGSSLVCIDAMINLTLVPYIYTLPLRVTTRFTFDAAGKVLAHEDIWSIREAFSKGSLFGVGWLYDKWRGVNGYVSSIAIRGSLSLVSYIAGGASSALSFGVINAKGGGSSGSKKVKHH